MWEEKRLVKRESTLRPVVFPVLRQERELITLGAQRRWPFVVLGTAPVPTEPVFCNDWWLVPANQDHGPIPARALERVQAIYEAGIRPKAFVVAHESPKELPAPPGAPTMSSSEFWSHRIRQHSTMAAKVAGGVLAAFAIPVTIAAAGIAALAAVGLFAALSAITIVDPCLIAVTEDDVWIQIDWWKV